MHALLAEPAKRPFHFFKIVINAKSDLHWRWLMPLFYFKYLLDPYYEKKKPQEHCWKHKNVHNMAHASKRSTSVEEILTKHLRRGTAWSVNGTFNLGIHPFNHPRDIYYALTMKDPKSVIPTFKWGEQGDNWTTLKRTSVLKSTDKVLGEFKENYKWPKGGSGT